MDHEENYEKAVIASFLAAEAMNDRADYLRRGRHHRNMEDSALAALWIVEFRRFLRWRPRTSFNPVADAAAELALRDLEPPFERVRAEMEAVRAEIREDEPNHVPIQEAISRFLEKSGWVN